MDPVMGWSQMCETYEIGVLNPNLFFAAPTAEAQVDWSSAVHTPTSALPDAPTLPTLPFHLPPCTVHVHDAPVRYMALLPCPSTSPPCTFTRRPSLTPPPLPLASTSTSTGGRP